MAEESITERLISWGKKAADAQYPTTLTVEEKWIRVLANDGGRYSQIAVSYRDFYKEIDVVEKAIDWVNYELRESARKRGSNG